MGGSVAARLEMAPHQPIAVLRASIAAQLAHRGHFRLVSLHGTLLADADGTIDDCLL